MAYTKLWHKIVTSSIWDADNNTRILWITMLALANRDGFVEASFKSLVMLARIKDAACKAALNVLSSPDEHSRTKTDDGRRLQEVDGGWQIINYGIYRDAHSEDPHAMTNKERQRKFRLTKAGIVDEPRICAYCGEPATGPDHIVPMSKGGKDASSNCVPCCQRCNNCKVNRTLVEFLNDINAQDFIDPKRVLSNPKLSKHVTYNGEYWTCNVTSPTASASASASEYASDSESGGSAEGDAASGRPVERNDTDFDAFWTAYPRKTGKKAALKSWRTAKDKPGIATILAAVEAQKGSEQWRKDGGQYIPNPATWLNQGRWDDRPAESVRAKTIFDEEVKP